MSKERIFRIKAATRDLIDRAGGVVRAGELSGVAKSTMHRFGSPDHGVVIPISAALVLEFETGCPLITRAMAEINGARLEVSGVDVGGHFLASFAAIGKETAELMAALTDAQADGTVTANEFRKIDKEASELQDALANLRKYSSQPKTVNLKEVAG